MKLRLRKSIILLLLLTCSTITFSCIPYFHPEGIFQKEYSLTLDLLFHGCYYFVISLLISYFLRDKRMQLSLLLLGLFLLSILLETVQDLIPGRSFSYLDILSNFLGIVAAVLFSFFVLKVCRKMRLSLFTLTASDKDSFSSSPSINSSVRKINTTSNCLPQQKESTLNI